MSIKRLFLCGITLLLMQGCGTSASKTSQMKHLVLAPKDNGQMQIESVKTIETDLKRGQLVAPDIFNVVPYTQPFVYAQASEEARQKNLNPLQTQQYIASELTKFTKGKQYFRLFIMSTYPEINPEYIHGEFIDSANRHFPIHFAEGVQKNVARQTTYTTPGYVGNNYYSPGISYSIPYNTTIAVFFFFIDTEVDFSQPFQIRLDPRYSKGLSPFTLQWLGPEK